jgi:hypothetical protein
MFVVFIIFSCLYSARFEKSKRREYRSMRSKGEKDWRESGHGLFKVKPKRLKIFLRIRGPLPTLE